MDDYSDLWERDEINFFYYLVIDAINYDKNPFLGVPLNKVKDYINFFIKNVFISEKDVTVHNYRNKEVIMNFNTLVKKIHDKLNLTEYEKNGIMKRVNDYLSNYLILTYNNATNNRNKMYFINTSLFYITTIINLIYYIFDEPSTDFLIDFITNTGVCDSEDYARSVFAEMQNFKDNSILFDNLENELISKWLIYAKVVIEHGTLFK